MFLSIIRTPLFIRRFGLPLLYVATLLSAAWLSHFAVFRNDVFPLRWQADHLSLHNPESFYNGFFTIGYPLLLRLVSLTQNPVLTIMLLQIAISPIYVLLLRRFFHRTLTAEIVMIAIPGAVFLPQIARTILTPTPDFAAALFALAGFVALSRSYSGRNTLKAGIFMGMAYLFRSHILVLVVAIVVALLLFRKKQRFRAVIEFLVGILPFVAIQGLIQVWSGHGFFENSQAFNVWHVMYGMDWNNPPVLNGLSAFQMIHSNPGAFERGFEIYLGKEVPYLIPLILAFSLLVFRPDRPSHQALLIPVLAALLYSIVTASGGSPRNVIAIIPIIVAACAFLVQEAVSRIPFVKRMLVARIAATIAWVGGITAALIFSSLAAHRVEDYREVENLLGVHSLQDTRAIYTDDFDLYFPDLRYAQPQKSGGWPDVGLPDYIREHPPIRDSSTRILHFDLAKNGVRWAVFRVPPYDPHGYQSVTSDTTLFKQIYRTPLHEIYRVE